MKTRRNWLWLLLLVPLLAGLSRLHFNVEVLDLLPRDLKAVQGLKIYQERFANARELVITLRAQDAEQAAAAAREIAERLRQQTNLVASVTWQPPWLERPGDAAELIAYLWLNQPPEIFSQLTNRLAPEKAAATLAETREQLATSLSPAEIALSSYDPFSLTKLPENVASAASAFGPGQSMFNSADGTFRLIFVQASRDLTTYRDCARWLSAIKQIVERQKNDLLLPKGEGKGEGEPDVRHESGASFAAKAGSAPFVRLGYTGRPAFVAEIAGGMEHDITTSVGGTSIIIAILFWLAHRRWKPMLWLLTLLALILGSTLALGGLIFGTINVVSMGFTAILLGLAVDYAVIHYQEALAHPNLSIPQIRRAIAPSIFWAAVTTISAFVVLNFGGLPGLGQLGSLVGLGVGLSACVMIFAFLPPLFPDRWETKNLSPDPNPNLNLNPRPALKPLPVLLITAALLLFSCGILLFGLPHMDTTADPLRPRKSAAYDAMQEIKAALNQNREPLWLLIGGQTETEVAHRLDEVQPALSRAVSNNVIAGFTLPVALWPRPEFQSANRATAAELATRREALRQAARTNGFAPSALGLTEKILDTWQVANAIPPPFWPTNQMSQWIFQQVTSRSPTNFLALALINPLTNAGVATKVASGVPTAPLPTLESSLPRENVWLSGWELLGSAIFSSVKKNMWKLLVPMISLVLLSLLLAFRRWREVLLSLAVLLLSGMCLLTVMRFAHWSWNLLNLMALPLILGTGVDYSIFMQLALRRYHGDLQMAHRSVGRALLLCGGTAIAGFGSLALSSNAGMASLGQVCAVGIAGNMLISIFLLPIWWQASQKLAPAVPTAPFSPPDTRHPTLDPPPKGKGPLESSPSPPAEERAGERRPFTHSTVDSLKTPSLPPAPPPSGSPSSPSFLYRAGFWRFGLWAARLLPRPVCVRTSLLLVRFYRIFARRRREVVIENLLPPLKDDRAAAKKTARRLFQNFAVKLVDLWRFEAGVPIDDLFGEATGWEHLAEAQAQKRGVLVLTPHLGNWEFGGPWLTRRGIPLQVITFAEPGAGFTELRRASRARWNIETYVIGDDPFAFVEIIRRLEAGATVALLMDRPPPATAVMVELFGRPFAASMAAAELARASGCLLLPVYLPRGARAYSAHVLPPIEYDRAALRDREARRLLTQKIMQTFEPSIRQYLDQWYHFVPIWPNR